MTRFLSDGAAVNTKSAHNRGWIWFFVVLVLLTVMGICIQIWYNPTVPLTSSLLAEAEAKWKEHGPLDYDMDYTIKTLESTEHFHVQVRQGKAVSVVMNDKVPLESRLYTYHTMPALFGFIGEFLEQDSQPNKPRTFSNVLFDAKDGHLIHYVRSVAIRQERVEISVRLTPFASEQTPKR
ncbi:MAG TPA: DUF6174 domain-containing protein [Gemmataceae bacterium]|nr:DUF6174 domain-containing protein [Gemmataceae bacterium]